ARQVAHKHAYLNIPFFFLRAGIYFISWTVISYLLGRWSMQQDESGEVELTVRQRVLGSGAAPYAALSAPVASFDWLMSLPPDWFSTIFGLYFLGGALAASMALLILVTIAAERAQLFGMPIQPAHYHSMGKLLLAFTCFWAYMAYSQYMLVWIGN